MVDPCKVCGGTDLNLVDGFYYCIECGTQDQTARETVVERVELSDGTFAFATRRKITKKKPKLQMSGEWYKWHAYNFIMCGLADELIALGAKPSFKPIALWIWTRYIKKYHNKGEFELTNAPKKNQLINNNDEDEDPEQNIDDENNFTEETSSNERLPLSLKDIKFMTASNIFGILFIALNLDKSDITLSHFVRYIQEGRITFRDCSKYIPSEFDKRKIPYWKVFQSSRNSPFVSAGILTVSSALFRHLDLGTPMIPDIRAMIKIYVKELCLPKDFLNLVLSLLEHMPIKIALRPFLKIYPDLESVVMAYVLMALKMCFGLDNDYELKISDVVDKINEEENHLKFYRLRTSEPSDRLFSFREWITYLEFRKIVLCQYFQPMASKHLFDEDNFLATEILKDLKRDSQINKVNIEIEHDILKKIPLQNPYHVIPKEQFPVSLTPLTTYSQLLMHHSLLNPETRLLLSEDFSKYSLKYACENMVLKDDDNENIVRGVREANKTTSKKIMGALKFKEVYVLQDQPVFIKDTDNKDWIKDFEAANDGKKINKENISDDETKEDIFSIESKEISEEDLKLEDKMKCEIIEELDAEENIFNDNFDDFEYNLQHNSKNESVQEPEYVFEFNKAQLETVHESELIDSKIDIRTSDFLAEEFDPTTFNRGEVIERLILAACRKNKIPIPPKYRELTTRKRKAEGAPKMPRNEVKIPRIETGSGTLDVNDILTKYHTLLQQNNQQELQVPLPLHLNEGNAVTESQPDLDTTVENSEDPPQGNEESHNVEDNTELNIEAENTTIDVDNVSNKESDKDIQALKEYEKNIDDCLDEPVSNILTKELTEFETNRAEKLKSLKEALISQKTVLKPKSKKKRKKRIKLNPLIPNSDSLKEFKYYVRHYSMFHIRQHPIQGHGFEVELAANYSDSFGYLIHYCASIIEVPAWNLYRVFQNLEMHMMGQIK